MDVIPKAIAEGNKRMGVIVEAVNRSYAKQNDKCMKSTDEDMMVSKHYPFDLELDLFDSQVILSSVIMSQDFAEELYAALCNMQWRKISEPELNMVYELKGEGYWHCSWRYAAGIVSRLRNRGLPLNEHEQYLDYYCGGGEGTVTAQVQVVLKQLGWEPMEWKS